jgi:thymidylate synthase (FAD)
MNIVRQSAEPIIQQDGIKGIYKQIERAGRTCYKSENLITEDSCLKFVKRMVDNGHLAMLEHGTLYLRITHKEMQRYDRYKNGPLTKFIKQQPFSHINREVEGIEYVYYITTNLRVILDNKIDTWELKNIGKFLRPFDKKYFEPRYTQRIITTRAIANELVRHRVFSFAQESTRYVNYTKEKSGGMQFIYPDIELSGIQKGILLDVWHKAEEAYTFMLEQGLLPEIAREVLPLSLKTEIVMTGTISQWRAFLDLRFYESTGKVHPSMLSLTKMLRFSY